MVEMTLLKDMRVKPGKHLMPLTRYLGIFMDHDRKTYRSYHRTKYYKGHPKEALALEALEHAVSVGAVLMPKACSKCSQKQNAGCRPQVAYQDLDHPLRFKWVCPVNWIAL